MKPSLKFNIKIPWNGNKNISIKMLLVLSVLFPVISEYNATLQNIFLNDVNVHNKRNVDESTTAVIEQDSISDDDYSKLQRNCPSLDRKIYTGHSPTGFLTFGVNTTKITYQKVPDEKASSLENCMDECCNQNNYCESIFAFSNNSVLNCFMITCQEGKYCLPAKSTKNVENSTAVVLLRPPSGVSMILEGCYD